MRAYYFGNMYLSSIQQGIQAAHVTARMFRKYAVGFNDDSCPGYDMLHEWAEQHETMILLSGGYGENLWELVSFFNVDENPYPHANFAESKEALDGALTSVGIILPEKIYLGVKEMRRVKKLPRDTVARNLFEQARILVLPDANDQPVEHEYSTWEVELMQRLTTFKLAQ